MIFSKNILISGPLDAYHNMAYDEVLLRACIKGKAAVPVLRFYDWKMRALSIGYFQRVQVALDYARANGVDFEIARRMTGGGIVLHGNDITFSLVVKDTVLNGLSSLNKSSIVDSYYYVNNAIKKGIDILLGKSDSPDMSLETKQASSKDTKFCFNEPTKHDVLYSGKKIAGGAQRRIDGYVMYQGSILFRQEIDIGKDKRFTDSSITLHDVCGRDLTKDAACIALQQGFTLVFGDIETDSMIDQLFIESVGKLAIDKYATHEWNYKR
ncbi:MAG: biotin/lipoate A/B protein ligase family protein [Candidatus Ancaeobacter aquaticus]|nr:biotin/lipoate A/B protein ligase family protein [Candidatus Ancaeobacter aquaticus]